MHYKALIERNPDVLGGKPIIAGTRIGVELIVRKMGDGYSVDDLLRSYPHLSREQVQACVVYAADLIGGEELIPAA